MACISLLALSGCGFHLRGPMPLPDAMGRVQIKVSDPHGRLAGEIADQLTQSGAKVVDAGENPDSRLEVLGDDQERRVASVDSHGKVTRYELRYTLAASLRRPGGPVLVPSQSVVVKKMLDADPASVLGIANEQEQLQAEMVREAVRQMLRQMRTTLAHGPARP